MNAQNQLRMFAVAGIATLVGLLGGCFFLGGDFVECDPDRGVCPPPEPGLVFDESGLTKSLWFQEAGVGVPMRLEPTICRADLDVSPGTEIVFRGWDGFAVLAVDAGQAESRAIVTPEGFSRVQFHDVEKDGNFEYLTFSSFPEQRVFFDHQGKPLWRAPDDIDLRGFAFPEVADIDLDGTLEFGARTADGIDVFDAAGTVLYHIPGKSFSSLSFGEFDGEGMLEVVTQSIGGLVETWRLDATRLGSFESPAAYWGKVVDRLPGDETRDYIRIKCTLFDIDGTQVGRFGGDSGIPCDFVGFDYAEPFTTVGSCDTADAEAETLHVRFAADREPFRVEPSYSINLIIVVAGFGGFSAHEATRTILRIYDPDDKLVYHEVIETESGPGSITVIPSEVDGEEILLVAEDTRILAYRIRHDSEET